jgi:hypothetical protein
MLVTAFTVSKLASTANEKWDGAVKDLYSDASDLVSTGRLTVPCLAKAILMCAVSNVALIADEMIPTEEMTWDDLRWRSIVFLSAAESDTESPTQDERMESKGHLRIPRVLWGRESNLHKKLREWVNDRCHFALDDLLRTVLFLYESTGEASATASGTPWEKMFASALVARFFVICWKEEKDPAAHFVPLHKLLPQMNEIDNCTLEQVEVCFGNGVKPKPSDTATIVSHRGTIATIYNIGRVRKFSIAGSISNFPKPCFGNVSVYGYLSVMQSTAWGNVVDEEQDTRNDGSKSSRSHRAFIFSNQLFLASTNAREISPFLRSNSGESRPAGYKYTSPRIGSILKPPSRFRR